MTENTQNESGDTPNTSETTPQSSTSTDILTTISEQLKTSGDAVRQKVVQGRVDAEVNKRADALEKALKLRTETQVELKKQDKPDNVLKDKDGKVIHEAFTDARIKERKKLQEKITKIDKAIDAAFNDNEWGKLKDLK